MMPVLKCELKHGSLGFEVTEKPTINPPNHPRAEELMRLFFSDALPDIHGQIIPMTGKFTMHSDRGIRVDGEVKNNTEMTLTACFELIDKEAIFGDSRS